MDTRPKLRTVDRVIIILICICLALVVTIPVYRHFFLQRQDDQPEAMTQQDLIDLRVAMSNLAFDSVGIDGEEFYNRLASAVDAAPTEDSRQSLKRFFIYLALRHGFPEGAYYIYKEYIDANPVLSDLEICELYDYRAMINRDYVTNEMFYDAESFELQRSAACTKIINSEAYKKRDNESTYSYAHRLFYSGLVSDAIPYYEEIYTYQEQESPENREARLNLADYYLLIKDYEKVSKYISHLPTRSTDEN